MAAMSTSSLVYLVPLAGALVIYSQFGYVFNHYGLLIPLVLALSYFLLCIS